MRRLITIGALTACALIAQTGASHAFCGFYVNGAGADMFNNATQVVLMREGTRTVLSMQNNYQGPPENFAMVIPVPVVLQEDNVKTLDKKIFQRVDQLAAPRLVEYWEKDPCAPEYDMERGRVKFSAQPKKAPSKPKPSGDLGVTVEAQFTVGEYEIVILSAKEATGLDTWLRQQNYKIPAGAAPLLKPYVESGSKFFVAKVDSNKVTFKDNQAMLSPLRFHYDSETFSLPVRLGLINSSGTQDLIVHILARGKRYEVSNYKNVTIPTNLDVTDETREKFGEFYAALFDATLEKNPGAVITEYSWDASTCDPCPTPALRYNELATLGQDVLNPTPPATKLPPGPADRSKRRIRPRPRFRGGFVLTRLHARYGKNDVAEDLIFKQAKAIAGGREVRVVGTQLEQGAKQASRNTFQGRYAIRHKWTGPIECKNPVRDRWGGPPAGVKRDNKVKPALDLAFAPRGKAKVASFVKTAIPELNVAAAGAATTEPTKRPSEPATPDKPTEPDKPKQDSKGCSAAGGAGPGWAVLTAGALIALAWVRRRDARALSFRTR